MVNRVYFYVPNLIGYLRVLLLFVAYTAYPDNFTVFFLSYFTSFILDAADGIAARALNQCS